MVTPLKITDYKNVPYGKILDVIKELLLSGRELDQIALRVNEYVNKFNKCSNYESALKKLLELGLKDVTAVLIVNIVPSTIDELKPLMNFEGEVPSKDKLEEIIKVIKSECIQS
ncbi:MAG: hypothetical protein DRO09_01015 [Thermoprotei archaeon]|nr:MAG: hypothetical protein DRO09_01015 [Thermoprotei archaeon]